MSSTARDGDATGLRAAPRPSQLSRPSHPARPAQLSPSTRLSGLDGLRAVAVVGVLIYHAGVRWLPGGFLGVDLFFVISGFLITWLLIAERQQRGAIAIGRFYVRRARRLLPALFTMVATSTAFMALFFRADLRQARGDIGAAAGYFSNWWYVLHHRSYFVAAGRQPPFQHLWSLAVEEQFYLVWPLLLAVLMLTRLRLRWVFTVAIAGALGSAYWMRVLAIRGNVPYDTDSSRLYFGTDTHASSLMLGATAAAIMLAIARRRERHGREVSAITTLVADLAGCAALAGVAWAMHSWSELSPSLFKGGFFEFAAIAAVVVSTASLPGSLLGTALDLQPMRWIGTRSYGLYLWHWPVFVFTRPGLDWALHGWVDLVARLAITAALTELTFRLIEQPIRERGFATITAGRPGQWSRSTGLWSNRLRSSRVATPVLAGVCGVLVVVGATSFVTSHRQQVQQGRLARAGITPYSDTTTWPDDAVRPGPKPSGVIAQAPRSAAAVTTGGATPSTSGKSAKPAQTSATATHPSAKPIHTATPPAGHDEPTPPPIPAGPPPLVSAVGDSVMLDGTPALEQVCPAEVYAVVGWQAKSVFAEIDALRKANHLGQVVVIGTGTNGVVSQKELDAVLVSLADRTKVVIVNNHMNRVWEPANNTMFPQEVKAHPNAVLVDWDTAANHHPEWIGSDGVHLAPAGRAPYADLIKQAAGC